MTTEQIGVELDQLRDAARQVQNDSVTATAQLAAYHGTLREQQAHLRMLVSRIDDLKCHLTELDRWHDDGGR